MGSDVHGSAGAAGPLFPYRNSRLVTDLTVEPFEQDGQVGGELIRAEMPQWFVDGITATALSRVSQRDATDMRE